MGRKPDGDGPKKLDIPTTPKLRAYLRDIMDEEGYGDDSTSVAKTLIWKGIEELISKGIIERRKGEHKDNT